MGDVEVVSCLAAEMAAARKLPVLIRVESGVLGRGWRSLNGGGISSCESG